MIKIYDAEEKMFNHNGIKILKPLKCDVFKEDNGDYYIDLEDNIENINYYQANMIITCPTPFPEGVQAFRIANNIEKNQSKIKLKAKHIYFDTKNYVIKDNYIEDKDCNYALDYLNSNTDTESPFITSSDITTNNSYRCVRKSLEESISTIIDKWGGHLVRDNFNISVNSNIGEDRGVTLKYLKNIQTIKSEEIWDNVVTKILPVGKDGLLLPEIYLELEEKLYNIPYTKVVSFNQEIEKLETESDDEYKERLIEDLRSQATSFLNANKYPQVNYSLSAHLDKITDIGDTIYVEHPNLNIALTTNVISVTYDAISNKYKNIQFGNFKNSLKDLLKIVSNDVEKKTKQISNDTKVLLEKELQKATSDILSMMGNSYVIYDGDKILIVDKLPKEKAKNVIRINSGGIGFSKTGINGIFNSAWAIDGTLNMQNINVINLVADMIKGGTLKIGGNNNVNGCIEIYDSDGNIIGKIDNNGFDLKIVNELQEQVNGIEDNIYTKNQVEQLIVNSEVGLTNIFSTSGGNNIFRNTSLAFLDNSQDKKSDYEFWNGVLQKGTEENSETGTCILLQNGTCSQSQTVLNGDYTISFKYKKIINLSNAKVYINNTAYDLENTTSEKEFILTLNITTKNIEVKFECDTNNGYAVYDLMVNSGTTKAVYSQNQNETITNTVNISKGIEVMNSNINSKTRIDADGRRTYNTVTNDLTSWDTEQGSGTNELYVKNKAEIVKMIVSKAGNQVWLSSIIGGDN